LPRKGLNSIINIGDRLQDRRSAGKVPSTNNDNCLQSLQNSNVILHETNFGHHFRNENDYSINIDLKMCSWNIEGLKKYYDDISFQSYCSRFDILSFCETWGVSNDEFENFLPGYTNFNFCRRKKNTAARVPEA
jgi:hypothetical protein